MSAKKINVIVVSLILCGMFIFVLSFVKWNSNKLKTNNPQYGGTFIYAVEDRMEELNPRSVVWFTSKNALSLIYDPLISVSKDLRLIPKICESWKMSEENKIFSCNIRKGVFFHDGNELSADDVVFSLNFILKHGGLDTGDFKLIKGIDEYWTGETKIIRGIQKRDRYNVEIHLKYAFSNFVSMLASPRIVVLPQNLNGVNEKEFFKNPKGSGPFVFKRQDDFELEVEYNKKYFLGRPYLEKIIFRTLSQDDAVESFKKGEVNDISAYSKNLDAENVQHSKRFLINSYSTMLLFVNNSQPPFDDHRYRKAIFSLIDRKRLADECFLNAPVANSIIPQGILGHDVGKNDKYEMFSIENARKLLSSLPVYNVILYHSKNGFNGCADEVINQSFKAAGVPWKVEAIDGHLLSDMFFSGKLQAHIETDEVKNDEAYTLLKYFESTNNENLSRINDPDIDKLLHEVVLTNELSKKNELYRQIDNIILDKAYALPILYPSNYSIIDGRYHGNEYRILTQYVDFTKIWKEKD